MAYWTTLKAAIANIIKTNGNQEITGQLLQNALNSIVNAVGENATFEGVAGPTTNPGTPDGPVFYLAYTPGVYSNFGGAEIEGLSVILWNYNNTWKTIKLLADVETQIFETKRIENWEIGGIETSTGQNSTDYTRIRTPEFYHIYGFYVKYNLSSYVHTVIYLYDESLNYLGSLGGGYLDSNKLNILEQFPTAKYARFSFLTSDITGASYSSYAILAKKLLLNKLENFNILYRKKWAVCGDSFSYGGLSTSEMTDEDRMPSTSKFYGKNKVYGYIIGDRNDMTIQDLTRGGRTMATPSNGNSNNAFSTDIYKTIDSDVDYITLYFGINDSHSAPGSIGSDGEIISGEIPIGTVDDMTINTFCGAYNVVLKYLLTNYPFAHIGIIVSNGCDTPEYARLTIQIAKKWGIPYIDLNEAPVMIRSQSSIVSSEAKAIINNKQKVSDTNMHPNTKAQEYESTFIEAFLRKI